MLWAIPLPGERSPHVRSGLSCLFPAQLGCCCPGDSQHPQLFCPQTTQSVLMQVLTEQSEANSTWDPALQPASKTTNKASAPSAQQHQRGAVTHCCNTSLFSVLLSQTVPQTPAAQTPSLSVLSVVSALWGTVPSQPGKDTAGRQKCQHHHNERSNECSNECSAHPCVVAEGRGV